MKKITTVAFTAFFALAISGTMLVISAKALVNNNGATMRPNEPVDGKEINKNDLITPLASAASTDIQNRLKQMRTNLSAFKEQKEKEAADRAAALKEKVASKKKEIEARATEAKKTKDEKRKIVLLNLLDIQIKQFTNTKERVAKMPNISVEQKTQLNTAIDAAIANLNAEKAKVQMAATSTELKQVAKEVKDMFKAKRDIVKKIVNAILSSRVQKAIDSAGDRLTEMKAKIAELKAAGKDVSELETLVANVEAKIAAAKAATSKEDLKKATAGLKDAYKELQKAIAKLTGMPVPSVSPTPTPSATPTPTPSVTPTPTPSTSPAA